MSTALERRWFASVAQIECCVLCHRYGVQVSHSNMLRGLSQKSAPWNTAALCPDCHIAIDSGKDLTQVERRELHNRAVVLTHAELIKRGLLVLEK